MMTPDNLIDERIAWVDDELRAVLRPEAGEAAVYGMLRYHLGWTDEAGRPVDAGAQRRFGGKRLRGALVILACEACGGGGRQAVPAAAAVELIHNFSLIHDDIEDADDERRHRPTVWRVWGIPQAINAGSSMQALVNRATLRLADRGAAPAAVFDVLRLLTDAVVRMTEGQCLDMAFQDRTDVDADAYFAMTERKTAALLAAALECGGRLALADGETGRQGDTETGRHGDEETESSGDVMLHSASPCLPVSVSPCLPVFPSALPDRLARFGRAFGLAFQARDDYLGVWGDPAITGKPVGSDLARGKRSLPVVLALGRSPEPALLSRRLEERDIEAVMEAMEALGVRAEVEATVTRLTLEALSHLEALGDTDAARALAHIAHAALARVN